MLNKLIATTITLTVMLSAPAFAGWEAEIAKTASAPIASVSTTALQQSAPRVLQQSAQQMVAAGKKSDQVGCGAAQETVTTGSVSAVQSAPSVGTIVAPAVADLQPRYTKVYTMSQPFNASQPFGVKMNLSGPDFSTVPEPGSFAGLLAGICGLGFFRTRSRRRQARG